MIFVDTGPFVAKYDASDSRHADAANGFAQVASEGHRWVTSSFVLCETLNLLQRFAGGRFAAHTGGLLLASSVAIVEPESSDRKAALALLEKFADQRVGYCDCVSFVIMRRLRLRDAFAFDRHFERAGFRLWPGT
jgi:predicted nucleic acid-binding protein